ncbi:MAG: hypothetical protein D6743_05050, partial [Calditrichaeota bacterium]
MKQVTVSSVVPKAPATKLKLAPKTSPYETIYVGFMAVFVTFVLLTNTVGVKLFTFMGRILPVSIIWFPLTFLITDIVS